MYSLYDLFIKLEELPENQLKRDLFLIRSDLTQIKLKDELATDCIESLIKAYDKIFPPPITAGIITLDEERCIHRCIYSLIDKVDEIIVIDGGSEDNTLHIVESMIPSENIYKFPWKKDFSVQRNYIFEKASHDWILFIDADEYFDAGHNDYVLRKILKVLNYLAEDILEYCLAINIRNGDGNIDYNMKRIVNKQSSFRFYGKVHEELLRCNFNKEADNLISLDINIEHDGYNLNVIKSKNKQKRNLELLKEMIKLEPQNKKWFFLYARDMAINYQHSVNSDEQLHEETHETIKYLELYLNDQDYETFKSANYTAYALFLICNQYLKLNDIVNFKKWFTIFKKEFPNCADVGYLELIYFNIIYNYKIESAFAKIEQEYINKESYSVVDSSKDHLQYSLFLTANNTNNFEAAEQYFLRLPQESILKYEAKKYLLSKIDKLKNMLLNA